MPLSSLPVEQILELVKQLPLEDKRTVFTALNIELQSQNTPPDLETEEWLEAELSGELPPYDWGAEGIPQGTPVRFIPGEGLVIEGEKEIAD